MTYPEAIKYLDSFIDYEKIPRYSYKHSFKLERVREFLRTLNNPQDSLKCIHIAGTKGKGSTCAFIAYILRQAQFKVGLYTSPHLNDFCERIRILYPGYGNQTLKPGFEGMIPRRELADLIKQIKPFIEKFNSRSGNGKLSFFEVYTALAFQYFAEKKIDFAVLETGLGGRLDATNTVNSLIAGITPISYEHIKQLGKTLIDIATEKVGIIKNKKSIVITTPQEKEVINVIRNRSKQKGAILYEIGKDVIVERCKSSQNGQSFDINGIFGRMDGLKISLLGGHQIINATMAVVIALALNKFYRIRLDLETVRNGLYNTTWPGRFEIIQRKPLIVLDGAQNEASASALRDTIVENFPGKRLILILGVSQDKDIRRILKALIPISEEVVLTQADNPRAAGVDLIEHILKTQNQKFRIKIAKTKAIKSAIELAKSRAGVNDLILVTGSLFLVGEARSFLLKNRDTLPMVSRVEPLAKRVSLKR
jgi:dihydrofolate synthase/folylpolyglutamate synthase